MSLLLSPAHLQDILLAGLVSAGPGEGGPMQLHRVLGGGQGAGVPLWGQGVEGGTCPEGTGTLGFCWGCGLPSSRKARLPDILGGTPLSPSMVSAGLGHCCGGARVMATSLGTQPGPRAAITSKDIPSPLQGSRRGSSFAVPLSDTAGRERVAAPKEGEFTGGEHQTQCFFPCPAFRGATVPLPQEPLHPQTEA